MNKEQILKQRFEGFKNGEFSCVISLREESHFVISTLDNGDERIAIKQISNVEKKLSEITARDLFSLGYGKLSVFSEMDEREQHFYINKIQSNFIYDWDSTQEIKSKEDPKIVITHLEILNKIFILSEYSNDGSEETFSDRKDKIFDIPEECLDFIQTKDFYGVCFVFNKDDYEEYLEGDDFYDLPDAIDEFVVDSNSNIRDFL